jgi:hypothetical protein
MPNGKKPSSTDYKEAVEREIIVCLEFCAANTQFSDKSVNKKPVSSNRARKKPLEGPTRRIVT